MGFDVDIAKSAIEKRTEQVGAAARRLRVGLGSEIEEGHGPRGR